MAKLRHIAISVPDLEKAAQFYETVFGMERHSANPVAINLSDGVMNVTILKFPTDKMAGDARGKDFIGIHHMGFEVEDTAEVGRLVEENGGRYMAEAPSPPGRNAEQKYSDPNGIVFDLSSHGWLGTS